MSQLNAQIIKNNPCIVKVIVTQHLPFDLTSSIVRGIIVDDHERTVSQAALENNLTAPTLQKGEI